MFDVHRGKAPHPTAWQLPGTVPHGATARSHPGVGSWLARGGRREALLAALVAACSIVVLRFVTPIGSDTSAHLYQTFRWLQSGFQFWDNYWYDGRYSFVDYSLLYYPIAGLIGQLPTVVASVASSAFLFSRLVAGRFGVSSPLPALCFAATAGVTVWLTGEYPFALGMAFALLALALRDRAPLTVIAAFGTLLASPLAFLFLLVGFAGIALGAGSMRRLVRPGLIVGLGLCLAAAAVLQLGFPTPGSFHFSFWALFQVLAMTAVALAISAGLDRVGAIRGVFIAMAVAAIGGYVVRSPLGGNVTRLVDYVGAPLLLILVLRQHQRHRLGRALSVLVAVAALAASLAPTMIGAFSLDAKSVHARFWDGAIGFLRAHADPNFRVEAVDTADHSDAYYLPAAGIPIVRGWFRQSDFPGNSVLYHKTIAAATYAAWLRRNGVQYVVLPHDQLDYSAKAEAGLLESGDSGLRPVYRDSHVTIYQLPDATPMLLPPAGQQAGIVALGHTAVVMNLSGPGLYRLAISYTRYWKLYPVGWGCVAPSSDGFTNVRVAAGGVIQLRFDPTLTSLLGDSPSRCPS